MFRQGGHAANYIYPPLYGSGCAEAETPYPVAYNQQLFQGVQVVNTDISLFRRVVGSSRIERGALTQGSQLPSHLWYAVWCVTGLGRHELRHRGSTRFVLPIASWGYLE